MSRVVSNFSAMGLNVYYFDRRGQGRNAGSAGIDTAFEDAKAVYEYVRAQVDGPLILHGLSLGGFEAASLSAEADIDALVLEATATNVDDFVEHARLPWFARPFIRLEVDEALRGFDNRDHLADYDGPLLLLSGEDDRQTAPVLMEKLYEASPSEPRRLVLVEDAHHNNIMSQSQTREAYRAFLMEIGLLSSD
nr:alpha/beta fold hydrolase [Natronospira proteinivora]